MGDLQGQYRPGTVANFLRLADYNGEWRILAVTCKLGAAVTNSTSGFIETCANLFCAKPTE